MKARLTDDLMKTLKQKDTRFFVWDLKITGLGIEVLPGGHRTWWYRFSRYGKPDKIRLGSWPALTLDAARKQVKALKVQLDNGEDPRYVQGNAPGQRTTIEALTVRFEAEYLPNLKPSTQAAWKRTIKKHIVPSLGSMLVNRLAKTDVQGLLAGMVKTPAAGNTARSVLSSMMVWAESVGLRKEGENPCEAVKPYPTHPRQVYLSAAQYSQVSAHLETLPGSLEVSALRLILLTGCRKGEVLGLQWSWVESNLIRIPWEFHKTGQTGGEKLIHLSPQAVEILEGIPKNGERVFPNQKGGNLWGIDPLWRQIRTDLELPSVHIHDLRHSYASLGINAGMSLGDIGVLLGHASITTTRRYAHIDQSYKIQKALQMGELLAEAMKPKT